MKITTSTDYTVRDQERMKRARRYFEWQFRVATTELGRRVIEVGCGLGNFTRFLLDRELVVALDIEEECVARLRENLSTRSNLIALRMDALEPAFRTLRKYSPDSIVCLNVLEHLADHRVALANMRAVLPPGGRVILMVPAFESLYGPIDRNLGHYRRYSKASLTAVARSAGLEPISLRYMNSVGCVGWWLNSHVFKKCQQSELQIAAFDSLLVPLLSRLERLIEPLFGQSIFAVLGVLNGQPFRVDQIRDPEPAAVRLANR